MPRPSYPIRTERLLLRPVSAADTDAMLAYKSRGDVCRYLPYPPMSRSDVLHAIASRWSRTELTDEGQSLTLGVEEQATGRLVGDVVLFWRDRAQAGGEIGYVFAPDVAGRGYATEAAGALLDWAFGELRLHRVIAKLDVRNNRSARLAERLGMRREAHHVSDEWFKGEWTDTLVYAVLAQEWSALSEGRSAQGGR